MSRNNTKLRVAVVQLESVRFDVSYNTERMLTALTMADELFHADLVVFPELCTSGYVGYFESAEILEQVRKAAHKSLYSVESLKERTKQLGVYCVFGFPEFTENGVYNSACLLSPSGQIIGTHRKTHLFGREKYYFKEGCDIGVYDTPFGSVGLAICYEMLFPEICRTLALKNANIIISIWSSYKVGEKFEDLLSYRAAVRAMENQVFVICCNSVGVCDNRFLYGHSTVASPTGDVLAQLRYGEGILVSELDLAQLASVRSELPVLKDRKPKLYRVEDDYSNV